MTVDENEKFWLNTVIFFLTIILMEHIHCQLKTATITSLIPPPTSLLALCLWTRSTHPILGNEFERVFIEVARLESSTEQHSLTYDIRKRRKSKRLIFPILSQARKSLHRLPFGERTPLLVLACVDKSWGGVANLRSCAAELLRTKVFLGDVDDNSSTVPD